MIDIIDLPDSEILLIEDFYHSDEALVLFNELRWEIGWEHKAISLYGKNVLQPRLTAYYGDLPYSYSGSVQEAKSDWPISLSSIRRRVEKYLNQSFNAVLANRYRDGRDSIGFHSDDEKELGTNPTIASISLGDDREFIFRSRKDKSEHPVWLRNGSLLVMAGTTQQHYQHGIKKISHAGERINLTFRTIF